MNLKGYKKYIKLVSKEVFYDDKTEEEVEQYIDSLTDYEYLNFREEEQEDKRCNIYYFYEMKGMKDIAIVDERNLETINPIEYESDRLNEYFKKMKSRYNQYGMLTRDLGADAGKYYVSYDRISKMLDNNCIEFINLCPDDTVFIIIQKNNLTLQPDSMVNSVLACIKGHPVYYIVDDGDKQYISTQCMKDLFMYMASLYTNDLPFYIWLGMGTLNLSKTKTFLYCKRFGNRLGEYNRVLPCTILKVEYSPIQIFKLDSVEELLKVNYLSTPNSVNQSINVRIKPWVKNTSLPEELDTSALSTSKICDVISGVTRPDGLFRKTVDEVMSRVAKHLSDSKELFVEINDSMIKVTPNRENIETAIKHEILQQLCNVFSFMYFNSSKRVFAQDLAIIKADDDYYICCRDDKIKVFNRDLSITMVEDIDGEIRRYTGASKSDSTYPLLLNNWYCTGVKDEYQPTKYQESILTKALMFNLTQFSRMDTYTSNIPKLSLFMEEGDLVYTDGESGNDGDNDKRILISYNSVQKIKNLIPKNLIDIPKSFNEPHITCLGEFGVTSSASACKRGNEVFINI